ncbi:MAG TPA: VacJ family lipoprotein [Burkholderiales bacterium]|nr:VacJ family lipoprotein [Burkholderiales bacterium]
MGSLRTLFLGAVFALALLPGCATINTPTDARDPLEPINRAIYVFNDDVDHLLLKPAAEIYRMLLPPIVRTGVSNFFSNINDVLVALNNLLQGKIEKAASDAGRVVINSTIGVLGVFDVATGMGLEKHDEDFGQTLGYWGVGDGPFLVLPFFGPSNFRDVAGRLVDFQTDPITYVNPSHDRNILWGVRIINRRSELLGTTEVLETAALDPYAFVRDAYLQRRRNLIYDGNPPPEPDDEGDAGAPAKPGNDNAKPKAEPRTEQNRRPVVAHDADEPIRSVMVSGEPLTPAERAAQEESIQRARGIDRHVRAPSASPLAATPAAVAR